MAPTAARSCTSPPPPSPGSAARLRAYALAAALALGGCGGDLLAPPPPPVAYVDLVASGRLASFDGVAAGDEVACDDEMRFAVAIAPGAEVRVPVELGDDPELELAACGTAPGARLRLEVRGSAGLASELELPVDASAWHERRLDLAVHARRRVDLRLRAEGPAGARVLVSDLHVRHRPPPEPHERRPDRSGPPPVLLVSLDTLRADALGPEATPALSAFAERAERWAPHYAAASWTKPSHASLLTGYPPEVHGAQLEPQPIRPGVPTLAERFAAAGYRTAGLVYDCEWLDPKWGFDRGFGEYRVMPWNAGTAVRSSVDWMVGHRDEPFFYFLHLFTPHSDRAVLPYEGEGVDRGTVEERFGVEDYGCRDGACASQLLHRLNEGLAPLPGEEEILRHLYGEGVATTDAALGRLFRDLDAAGLFDRLLIVVTSDHGEAFFEHGLVLHSTLHREVLEVPLLVKWPAGSPHAQRAGTRRDLPSSAIDVAPTLLAAAGIAAGSEKTRLPGTPLPERSAIVPIFAGTTSKSILTRRFHAIFRPGGDGVAEAAELYDLLDDPAERNDLASAPSPEAAETLTRLRRRLVEHLEETRRTAAALGVAAGEPAAEVELTPEERRRLEGLGYLN